MKCYLSTRCLELFREYFLAPVQQYGIGQGVNQANSQSGSGVQNPRNQGQTTVQNVAPPLLLPLMQSPRPPTPVVAPLNSNTFDSDLSKNPQVNQFQDQSPALLGPKISSIHIQLNFSDLFSYNRIPLKVTLQTQHNSLIPISRLTSFYL